MNRFFTLLAQSRNIVPALMFAAAVQFSSGTTVVSTVPSNNALHISASTTITVLFSGAMNSSSFNDTAAFIVSGTVSGRHRGTIVLSGGNTIATFTPTVPFLYGEEVQVSVSDTLLDASNAKITPRVFTFTVAFSSAPGTFSSSSQYSANSGTQGAAVGDMDMDGNPDIAVSNTSGRGLSTYRNYGNGTFAAKVDYQTGTSEGSSTYSYDVAVGDLSGDGKNDIIVSNCNSEKISILINNGDGTYAPWVNYSAGGAMTGPSDCIIRDLDGDGDNDVAIAAKTSKAAVFLNNGDGTFAAVVTYTAGSFTCGIAANDIDNDGDQDLVTANEGTNTVSVFLNNGDGTFASKVDYVAASGPIGIEISDLNGDGYGDIVTVNATAQSMSILLNDGDGTFGTATSHAVGSYGRGVALGDIDGDGDHDIVGTADGYRLYTFKNNGTGAFGTRTDYNTVPYPQHLAVVDLDADGDADIVTALSTSKMFVYRGTGYREAQMSTLSNNSSSGATLNGSVRVAGNAAVVRFLIGTTSGVYTDSVAATESLLADSSAQSVSAPVTGLTPSTMYYVRLAITGADWYLTSLEMSFSTASPDTIPGFAITFDGTNDYIEVPYTGALNPTQFTVELWARVDGGAGTWRTPIASRGSVGSNLYGYNIYASTANRWSAWIGPGTTAWCALDGGAVTIGAWTHLAMTHDGTNFRFYVNGVLKGDTVITFGVNASKPLRFGSISDALNFFFKGTIDEVRIWSTARSAQSIRETMHRTITDSVSNLVANWHFAEGNGTTATDAEEGRSGTLNNFEVLDPYRWTSSTIPVGPVSAGSASAFTGGTASLGTVSLTTSDAFDNAVELTAAEIGIAPNTLPSGSTTVLNDRYWVINSFGTPGTFSANLTFTVPSSFTNNGEASPSNFALYHRSGNSDGTWSTAVSSAASLTSTTITFNGVSTFSQFAIGSDDPLPVEMVSLTAVSRQSDVELNWKTATEVNNHGFEIEKLSDSQTSGWKKIGFVEGNGTTNAPKEYSFTERGIPPGRYTFRLKQIDRDGTSAYSQEVEVSVGAIPMVFELHQNYPNPFNPSTTIGFTIQRSGFTSLKVYDAVGREVKTLVNEYLEEGVFHQKVFDATQFASGIYFYRLLSGGMISHKKMIMLK